MNAVKFLETNKLKYKVMDIQISPPTLVELHKMLKFQNGNLKKMFNTSGMVYREMGLSNKMDQLSEKEALELLAKEGMLVKRPFLLSDDVGLLGFKESAWKEVLEV